jgi:hypothetical protein
MLSTAQLRKIQLLSDTVLYTDAVNFIRRLVQDQECAPLPNKQANGLLSIAEAAKYRDFKDFITNQKERDWLSDKGNLKTFYDVLCEFMDEMKKKRLRGEFQLIIAESGRPSSEIRHEEDALMILLAREFIQHLIAENGLLLAKEEEKKRAKNWQRRER